MSDIQNFVAFFYQKVRETTQAKCPKRRTIKYPPTRTVYFPRDKKTKLVCARPKAWGLVGRKISYKYTARVEGERATTGRQRSTRKTQVRETYLHVFPYSATKIGNAFAVICAEWLSLLFVADTPPVAVVVVAAFLAPTSSATSSAFPPVRSRGGSPVPWRLR